MAFAGMGAVFFILFIGVIFIFCLGWSFEPENTTDEE